jgi:hypothetical protein
MQSNDSLRLECFLRTEQNHGLGQRQNSSRDQIFVKYTCRRKNKDRQRRRRRKRRRRMRMMSKNETSKGQTCNLIHHFNGERREGGRGEEGREDENMEGFLSKFQLSLFTNY